MPRLIACMVCSKIERIPDPPADTPLVPATVQWDDHGVTRDYTFTMDDGTTPVMVPEYDPLMEDVVARHGHDRPDTEVMQFLKAFPVDQATYDKMDIVTELKKELQNVTGQFFEEAMWYRDEAVKCYNAHGNPEGGCIDYLDDSKRIGSSQIPQKHQVYLCHMCPIQQAYINVELRKKAGYYDPVVAKRYEAVRDRKMRRLRGRR